MFEMLFGARRALIGMIHLPALPGTPESRLPIDKIAEQAAADAREYARAGYQAVLLENMHDRPYLKGGVGPEIVAAMTRAAQEVRRAVQLPVGVQVLAAANREALAVAFAAGAAFVRVEGFVFGHVADEGFIEAGAGELLRYRRAIGATDVRIFADIKKKHSAHAVTADVDIAETARAAEFFLADGVIVTGAATASSADAAEVAAVSRAVRLPVFVGSGITAENIADYPTADGFIVGSSVKRDGVWWQHVDSARVEAVANAFRRASATS